MSRVSNGILRHVTPNVFSVSQVKRSKPAPDVCIVVEDSVAGVTAARRAGMRSVGFIGGGHAYDALQARLSEAGVHLLLNGGDWRCDWVDLEGILRKFQTGAVFGRFPK
ncbi:HAD family hydrolase [Rhizobium leguminosarum]|uniref:HAD family hydrolase n=1 Tax=Rhizobium leguminosarum TaxID=384 RepID=UPI001C927481